MARQTFSPEPKYDQFITLPSVASQLTTALAHKGSSPAARSVEAAGQLVQLHAPEALE